MYLPLHDRDDGQWSAAVLPPTPIQRPVQTTIGGAEVEHNLLSRDKANGNGLAGGIVVQGSVSANRLQGNTANAGRGIAAARGAIDGGGNRARDNPAPSPVRRRSLPLKPAHPRAADCG
jgi:parallel beta-helix repeat protein